MSITDSFDIDILILNYIEPSYLAYLKTLNKNIYYNITNYCMVSQCNILTRNLICTPNFVETYLQYIKCNKTVLFNKCVEYNVDLNKLKFLYSHNVIPEITSFYTAALNGNLDNMKWMLENNFPQNAFIFAFAAKNGNLGNMKWMFENNFSKNE